MLYKYINSLNATSIVSNTSSFIEPVYAKFSATVSSSNFGHKTPGVSSNSILLAILTHCFCFVTPGLFPTIVVFLLHSLFINDDFPTFGIPSITTLMFFFTLPFNAAF